MPPGGKIMTRIHLFLLLIVIALLTGCAQAVPAQRAKYAITDFEKPGKEHPLEVYDPISSVNKGLYRFNYNFDRFLFLPVVNTYEFIMPN